MIKARHHWFFKPFFDRYITWLMKHDFHYVEVEGSWTDEPGASLIVGNHISWWDGFWALYLNNQFLHKKIHVMMLEEQLLNNRILNTIGAFSISPGHRSVMESLHYASDVLNQNGNALVMYPQGEIKSQFAHEVPFQKGIEWVMKRSGITKVYFYVALTDYYSSRKPTLTFYLMEEHFSNPTAHVLQEAFSHFHSHCIKKQALKP
jgi:1-acyl-sn-glycerol-3-phosphate acyltransferase